MPHLPDHVTHDPELIAAYAAGDATGTALDQAADLVAACTECADLHRDLRAISTALPELPAPVRPRDFRLTPEQAASLRPVGWRGAAGGLRRAPLPARRAAGRRSRRGRPRGSPAREPGRPPAGCSIGRGHDGDRSTRAGHQPSAAAASEGGNAGGAALAAPAAPSAAASAPVASDKERDGAAIQPVPAAGGAAPSAAASSAPEFAAVQPAASPLRNLAATAASGAPDATRADDTIIRAPSVVPAPVEAQVEAPASGGPTLLLLASGLLLLVGVALVVLRLVSRRVA